MWHELKEGEKKPTTKQQLIDVIHAFLAIVDVAKYIRHLRKVLPRIIEL